MSALLMHGGIKRWTANLLKPVTENGRLTRQKIDARRFSLHVSVGMQISGVFKGNERRATPCDSLDAQCG